MAARQQLPNCRVKVKSIVTDSKGGKETHVGLEVRTTEDGWDRLGKLVKTGGVTLSLVTLAPTAGIDEHIVGEETDQMRHERLKKETKEVQKVAYIAGKGKNPMAIGSVRDIGLIKCLSVMFDIPNPFLHIPALDGFECNLDQLLNSEIEESGKPKSQEIAALDVKIYNMSMIGPCSRAKFKATEKPLMTALKQMNAIQDADARMKAKAAEKLCSREKAEATENSYAKQKSKAAEVSDSSNSAKTIEESNTRKRAKATEDSDAKIESKAADGSSPSKKPDAVKESDSSKRTKTREKSSPKHELKATERETRSRKDAMMHESDVGKATDDQGMSSSRPGSKSVRTCMNCGLQEPAPKVFKKCRRCKDEGYPDPPYYCGRDCQVLDWTARHRQQHEMNHAGDPATS